jgi:hypothetical protein
MLGTCIIGYTGFVGFNLCQQIEFDDYYNSKNINDIKNKSYATIVCCGIDAKKWIANKDPENDLIKVSSLIDVLKTVKCDRFIHISTIDVYGDVSSGLNESHPVTSCHPYGDNRLYAEMEFKKIFTNIIIVRLPGLFGYGLKKNIVYDLINNRCESINLNSKFQWYYLGDLWNDIQRIICLNGKVVNLFTEPISNKEIFDIFSKYSTYTPSTIETNTIDYNCTTIYSHTKYWACKEYILRKLDNYIKTMLNNKLIISHLSWIISDELMMEQLSVFGIRQYEIAINKYFNMPINEIDISSVNNNKNIYSIQSILYPLTENIFNDTYKNYLYKTIDVCSSLGAKIIVFGSPKNRNINTDVDYINYFKDIGDYAIRKNIYFCIEPNSSKYICTFVINSEEGNTLIERVNSPGFRLHLDIGNMIMEEEDILNSIYKYRDNIKHIHFSAPFLKLLDQQKVDYNYLYLYINNILPDIKISIEMLNQNNRDIIRTIYKILS